MAKQTSTDTTHSGEGFSKPGRQLVRRLARSLQKHPTCWILQFVRVANLWQAESVQFRFSPQILTIEINGVEEMPDLEALQSTLPRGELSARAKAATLQRAVWDALAQTEGSVSIGAGSAQALRVSLESASWQSRELDQNVVVIEVKPAEAEAYFAKFGASLEQHLEYFSCSDICSVVCPERISSFVPISPRLSKSRPDESPTGHQHEVGYSLAALAFPTESKPAIPLGRTFGGLGVDGLKRRELTFGCFRVAVLGDEKHLREAARTVVCFTHHSRATPSRAVWLWQGTEVAHQDLAFAERQLAITLYLPLPDQVEWDPTGQHFPWRPELGARLDKACQDLRPALESLVGEFNDYSPGIEGRTAGCWLGIFLSCLGLAGILAPAIGSRLALGIGVLAGFLAVIGEFRGRARLRWSIGLALQQLADELVASPEEQKLWRHQLSHPWGEPFISQDSP